GSIFASAARRMYVSPSASSAIVMPPDADPVREASTLTATARDASGPPPIESTHSRTTVNPGSSATTAPNPTRLATPKAGSTEALAPASMLSRKAGSRDRLKMMTVATAAASATATDHTPPTDDSEAPAQPSYLRNDRSSLGNMMIDMRRLTTTTITSGNMAQRIGAAVSLMCPRQISAGSNSRAAVARSRTNASSTASASALTFAEPKPSPALRAAVSAR